MNYETLKKCNLCASRNIYAFDDAHNIWQCRDCGYVFDNPRPGWEDIKAFYSKTGKYDHWLRMEGAIDDLYKRRVDLIRRYKKEGSLLDIGTGWGQFLFWAKHYYNVTGTEISQSAIRIAQEKYGIALLKGELQDFEFSKQFDIITLLHVLEHLPDPAAVLRKCKELLKDDGILVVAVPNEICGIRKILVRLLSLFKIGRFKNYGKIGLPKLALDGTLTEMHLSHFRTGVLRNFLKQNGFKVSDEALDPFYAAEGLNKIAHKTLYLICLALKNITGINFYLGLWLVAKKA